MIIFYIKECYSNHRQHLGSSEFNHKKVLQFLEDLYGSDHIDYHGLKDQTSASKTRVPTTDDFKIYPSEKEGVSERNLDENGLQSLLLYLRKYFDAASSIKIKLRF